MHISSGIYLTAEENPRKPRIGDRLMNGISTEDRIAYDVKVVYMRKEGEDGEVIGLWAARFLRIRSISYYKQNFHVSHYLFLLLYYLASNKLHNNEIYK